MTHVHELMGYIQNLNTLPVKPLRLLLLGTAGTGKTTTVQTALQEMLRHLTSLSGRVPSPTASREAGGDQITARRCVPIQHLTGTKYARKIPEHQLRCQRVPRYATSC